jgi:hypothetical protein
MLKRSVSAFAIVLLFSSFALAGQSTTTPVPAGPQVQSKPVKAPRQKQRLKKHKERAKKPVTPPTSPATPPPQK